MNEGKQKHGVHVHVGFFQGKGHFWFQCEDYGFFGSRFLIYKAFEKNVSAPLLTLKILYCIALGTHKCRHSIDTSCSHYIY